jgi:hypothetical protein
MVAAGCVDKMVFAFTGNSSVGSSHAFATQLRLAAPDLELEEYSHYGLLQVPGRRRHSVYAGQVQAATRKHQSQLGRWRHLTTTMWRPTLCPP